jgi:hypothetical protein
VPSDHRCPLPIEIVRDLLGIARVLYRSAKSDPRTPPERLAALEHVGKEIRAALELARKSGPDTLGHRAAWARSERAIQELCRLSAGEVPGLLATALAVSQGGEATRGSGETPLRSQSLREREARRLARRERS